MNMWNLNTSSKVNKVKKSQQARKPGPLLRLFVCFFYQYPENSLRDMKMVAFVEQQSFKWQWNNFSTISLFLKAPKAQIRFCLKVLKSAQCFLSNAPRRTWISGAFWFICQKKAPLSFSSLITRRQVIPKPVSLSSPRFQGQAHLPSPLPPFWNSLLESTK